MTIELERPLRNPDTASPPLMDNRAAWLGLRALVPPGSAHRLRGSWPLGRLGITATIVMLLFGALALAGFLWARELTLSVFTNGIAMLALQVVILAYAVLWLILGFDTLRLTRLVRLSPRWRAPIAVLSVVLTLVPVAGAAWAATTLSAARTAIGDIFVNAAPSVEPIDGRYNILLLGVDAGEDREGLRPDSISLVSVDAETGQSAIIGLPRELTEMPFPETSPMYELHPNGFCMGPNAFGEWGGCLTQGYLNGIFAEVETLGDPMYAGLYPDAASRGSSPGIEATKDAVTGATGLVVQFYVLIDMHGFAALIDALGGVTIDVKERVPVGGREDEVTGEWVDIAWYIEPGVQTLDGENAQWYARSRHGSAGGDYDRMERQRELQTAILAQMDPANVLLRFQEIAAAGTDLVETDIPSSMLGYFVNLASKAREFTPVTFDLTPPDVDPEYPDYAYIHQRVAETIAVASPTEEPADAE